MATNRDRMIRQFVKRGATATAATYPRGDGGSSRVVDAAKRKDRNRRARYREQGDVGSAYRNRIPTPGLPPSDWPVRR